MLRNDQSMMIDGGFLRSFSAKAHRLYMVPISTEPLETKTSTGGYSDPKSGYREYHFRLSA